MFFNELLNKKSDSPAIEKNEIQTHNFENAKNALKKFSEDIPSSSKLPTVDTHQYFGLVSRDVTGSELNMLTAKIQDCLVATNNQQIRVIKEFEQIYQTFEALDKDYIQGIIAGIKAAETASNQAMSAAKSAFEAAHESEKNTKDIKTLIVTQRAMIEKLVAFKERIEKIPNIDDVSTMWKDIQDFKSEILDISDSINQSQVWAIEADKLIREQELILSKTVKFKEEFEAIPHILDFKIIWDDVQNLNNQVPTISYEIAGNEAATKDRFAVQDQKILSQNEELVSLINTNRAEFSKELTAWDEKQLQQIGELTSQIDQAHNEIRKLEAIPHILDLKIIWDDIQNLNSQVPIISTEMAGNEAATKERFAVQDKKISFQSEKLASLINTYKSEFYEELTSLSKKQSQQIEDFTNQIEIIQNKIIKNESENEQRFAIQNTQLMKKIKIAYMVAGVSGAITLAHVVLSALGIV